MQPGQGLEDESHLLEGARLMNIVARDDDLEPTSADLAAIEEEWPQIEADLAVLDAEIAEILAESLGAWDPERSYRLDELTDALDEECVRVTPLDLDWRSRRRAAGRLLTGIRQVIEAPGRVAA
jgi:hypothetical protein